MNYPYTAQCPSCNAELNLTQSDMEQAEGSVVCGNCQVLFHAPNNLLKGFYPARNRRGGASPIINPAESSAAVSPAAETKTKDKMSNMETDLLLPSASKYSAYRRKRMLRRSALLLLNLVLVLFFLFQLLWMKFDEWVVKEHLRPIYSFLCSIDNLHCSLPAWIEPETLALEDFAVQLKDNSVYVMEAQLTNKGDETRPFPWVDVVFSDINGITIASGRFSPYQYLLPQETDSLMKVGGSYDILLEVRKPSHPVVSYEMRLVAAAL